MSDDVKKKGIYRRGKIYWISYAGVDGRIHRESAQTKNKDVADKLLTKRKTAVEEGITPDAALKMHKHPFSELCGRYDTVVMKDDGYRTKQYYIRQLKGVFGKISINKLSQEMLEILMTILRGKEPQEWPVEFMFIKDNRPANFRKAVYSPSTINRVLSCFKHMMTKGAEWGFGAGLPDRFRKVKKLKENERTDNYSIETCEALVAEATTVHHRVYVLIGLNAGPRNTEAMHLQWGDIDLAEKTIAFRPAYTKDNKLRIVPINEALHQTLMAWRNALEVKPSPGDWLFRDEITGKRIKSFRTAFSTMCKAVGVDCRYHALRHTFASKLAAKKVHVKVIADLIGDNVDTCMRYVHHDKSMKVDAVEEIGIGGTEALKQRKKRVSKKVAIPAEKTTTGPRAK